MRRPTLKTRLAGHPIIVLPMIASTLWSFYLWTQNLGVWPMVVVLSICLNRSMKANQQVANYKAWQYAWDGLASPPASARKPHTFWRKALVGGIFASVIGYAVAHIDKPEYVFALSWMVAIAGIAILASWWRTVRRRHRRVESDDLVSVVTRRPMLPVPTLANAFAMLPPHCAVILRRQA